MSGTGPTPNRSRRSLVLTMTLVGGVGMMSVAQSAAASVISIGQVVPAVTVEAPTTQTATVADSAEAWFADFPVNLCSTPVGGCAPNSPSALSLLPKDTLHIGEVAGLETARAYVVPDLAALPSGSTAISGTMTLPVATATTDGSVASDTAELKACLATQPVPDGVQGSTAVAPTVDCGTTSPLRYDSADASFTVDLTPFLSAWARGKPVDGIALLPKGAGLTQVWQVTLNGRKRAGVSHIRSSVTVQPTAPAATGTPSASPQPNASSATPTLPSLGSVPPSLTTVPQGVPAPVIAQPATRATAAYIGYQYPAAFLVPVGLLVLAIFLVRLFTRDLTPRRR